MKNLKDLVGKLETLTNSDEIVEQLKEINKCFLQNYIIKINDLEIYPVEVEIYYFKDGVFEDENCHQNELQKNHFGKLYFHRAGRSKKEEALIDTNTYGGVDVCISKGDYYLSILIRSAYINELKKENLFSGINKISKKIINQCIQGKKDYCIDYLLKNIEKIEDIINKRTENINIENIFYQPRISEDHYSTKDEVKGEKGKYKYPLNSLNLGKDYEYLDIIKETKQTFYKKPENIKIIKDSFKKQNSKILHL